MNATRKIEWSYYAIQFVYWFATGLPIALIVLLMQARGLDLFQIGILLGIYSAVIVLLELPTGGLADAIGRKPVTILAYSLVFLYSTTLLFAFTFEAFALTYVLYGIARALSSGALDAWFLDALKKTDPDIEIQPRLAKAGTFVLLGLGLGTFGGGLLAQLFNHLPPDGTAVITPASVPILFALAFKFLLVIMTFFLIKEDRSAYKEKGLFSSAKEVPAIIKRGFSLARGNLILVMMLGATFVSGLALSGLENLWQPRFAELLGGAEGDQIYFGIIMGGTFLVGMIGNMLATFLTRIMKKRYALVAMIGQIIKGGTLIILALLVHPIVAIFTFWMTYFATGLGNSPQATLVNEEIPDEQRSSMLSIFSLMSYFGAIAGSVVLGYVAQYYSISTAWLIAGVLVLLSVIFYLRADREHGIKKEV